MVGTFDSDYADAPTIHFVNKVTSISTKGCELDSRSFCAYGELVPIPLTEEWLMKAEFYVSTGTTGPLYTIDDISALEILYDNNEEVYSVSYGDLLLTEIKYLHQLQNLYYCLCGEELKIGIN